GDNRDLHSFPTRRSSDLARAAMVRRTRNVFFILSPLDECFSVKLISNSVVVASGLPALTSFPLDVFPFGKKTVRFVGGGGVGQRDRKSTRLNSSHVAISY